MIHSIVVQPNDMLLMVDLIGAFFNGGGLPVPCAEELIRAIHRDIHDFFPPDQRVNIRESHPSGAAYNVRSYIGRRQGYLTLAEIVAGLVTLAPHAAFTLDELRATTIRHTCQRIMLWNEHALDGTAETQLHPGLKGMKFLFESVKGTDRLVHAYSGFYDDIMRPTGLATLLRGRQVKRVFTCGLAEDFCVGLTALHAAWEGFESYLITDWCRAIDLPATATEPGSVAHMYCHLDQAGVRRIVSDQIAPGHR